MNQIIHEYNLICHLNTIIFISAASYIHTQVCYKMCPFRNFKNHFKSNYLHFINENLSESAILIEFKKKFKFNKIFFI